MALSATRKIHLAAALMLGCCAMPLPAYAGWFDFGSTPDVSAPKPDVKSAAAQSATNLPATNLEDSIRQAQMLRLAGQYPEAIKHLSQLMMVAADDSRVVSEYGKTLAAMGRAMDAVNFLTRAQQLQPNDWTVYSALGVSYDQLGDQKNAQLAYEHALSLKPEEPSVLNNYALSRMLAKDPGMARKLALRAESAGGSSDVKIARNIAMIRSLEAPAPAPVAVQAAPQTPVAHNQLPAQSTSNARPASVSATATPPQMARNMAPSAAETHDNRVVMQRVPVDPLAGPVQPAKTATAAATHAPNPLQPQSVAAQSGSGKADTLAKQLATIVKTDVDPAAKVSKPGAPSAAPVAKVAEASKPASVVAAKAPVSAPTKIAETKPVPVTPAALPAVKAAEVSKPVAVVASKAPVSSPVKMAETKPAPVAPAALPVVKTAEASKPAATVASKAPVSAPVKMAETKPVPAASAAVVKAADTSKPAAVVASKMPVPAPLKMAETKPAAGAAKPAAAVTLKITPIPVKAVDTSKPAPAPKVLPAVTTTDAKAVPVKAAAKTKDTIPGLRMSANAY